MSGNNALFLISVDPFLLCIINCVFELEHKYISFLEFAHMLYPLVITIYTAYIYIWITDSLYLLSYFVWYLLKEGEKLGVTAD